MNIRRQQQGLESVVFVGPLVIAVRGNRVEAILSGEAILSEEAPDFETAVDTVLAKLRHEILSTV